LEYEADFWIGIMGVLLKQGAGFAIVWMVFQFIPEVQGWSLWEMAFLYALYVIPIGLVELFYDGQWRLPQLVNSGDLDRILLRPISPALQVITQIASVHGLGSIIIGVSILVRSLNGLQLQWDTWQWILLCITFFSSMIIIGSINFLTNCIVFWEPSQNAAFPMFTYNLTEFAKYPSSLYTGWIRAVITWMVPVAFVSYYPSTVLLGKPNSSFWLGYASPLIGPIVLLITWRIWQHCLTRYQGTGT
jgi:ABC-2 type transport system permease protein